MNKIYSGRWVALIYRATQIHINEKLAGHDIGAGQYSFILYIGRCSGRSQEEISETLSFDKGTTARAISRLEKAGYVIRKESSKDHRKNEIFITEKGLKMRTKIRKMLKEWHKKLFDGISDEMKEQVNDTLFKMACNANIQIKEIDLVDKYREL